VPGSTPNCSAILRTPVLRWLTALSDPSLQYFQQEPLVQPQRPGSRLRGRHVFLRARVRGFTAAVPMLFLLASLSALAVRGRRVSGRRQSMALAHSRGCFYAKLVRYELKSKH
jgi:hypothetical protein